MVGVHCEIYEAFKVYKYLRIGVSYAVDEDSLQIFPNEDFLKPGEDREPIIKEKILQLRQSQNIYQNTNQMTISN
jgi:hypothetical protein